MKHPDQQLSFNLHTDLALEAHDIAIDKHGTKTPIDGLRREESTSEGITTSWIWVEDEVGSKKIGKQPGTYLTIEAPALRERDSYFEKKVMDHLTTQLKKFLTEIGIKPDDTALIVGLGNWKVTADALGPLVVGKTLITRHLFAIADEEMAEGYRAVSAISPGVMGITGVETSEIVSGVVEKVKPDFVIAIDALASRALSRVNTTIQIADTGIYPGSGIGNRRKAINKQELGVPVIAIGVPTVVDASTIAHDAIDFVLSHLSREMQGLRPNPLDPSKRPNLRDLQSHDVPEETSAQMLGMFGGLAPQEKWELIRDVLSPLGQNLVVTPKEVDSFIGSMANVISNGLNRALHAAVTADNISAHMNH